MDMWLWMSVVDHGYEVVKKMLQVLSKEKEKEKKKKETRKEKRKEKKKRRLCFGGDGGSHSWSCGCCRGCYGCCTLVEIER